MSDLNLEGVSPEIAAVLQSDTVKALIASAIEQAKAPLVAKRDELLGTLTETRGRMKQYDDLGGLQALTELQASQAAAEAARQAALAQSGDVEAIKTHYSNQLSTKDKELNDLRASVMNEKVSNKLNAAIREAKGVPELLQPHLTGRVRSELVDGQVKITVLTASGVPALNADGKEASISDLLAEFKGNAIFGRAFEAPVANGSGSKASGAQSANNPFAPASKNITEQMKMYKQDKALAVRMAAEHGIHLT